MIEVNISKENEKQVIAAQGAVPELVNDIAVLISGIYNQFLNVDSGAAEMFRVCLQAVVRDREGSCWKPTGNQTGIIFKKPEE